LSGSQKIIREMKQFYDKGGKQMDFTSYHADVHAVAGLLKLFFAELQEPIGTFEFYEGFFFFFLNFHIILFFFLDF
jgi:hypothetical protein